VKENADLFAFWGVTPESHPIEVVMAFEVDATPRRSLAYGSLFGYPKHAVDFFVSAERQQRATQEFVQRDFFHVPVFSGSKNQFVYAVPKGSSETPADRALKARCAPILAKYKKLREKYFGPGRPGPHVLLRDWFDQGNGLCRVPMTD
jgi:hypothetical protein